MTDLGLSRREVLAGLAAAGSSGAVVGSGTAALFSDEESFANNGMQASTAVSGEMDLDVVPITRTKEIEWHHGGGSETSTVDVPTWRVTLPDEPSNNPAYLWLRIADCPHPLGLSRHVDVRLLAECDDRTLVLLEGSLLSVAQRIRDGMLLDPRCFNVTPGDQECFQPGDDVTIVLDWDVGMLHEKLAATVSVSLEFHARQCRYNDGTLNPFPEAPSCLGETRHAISFIGFCSDEDGNINPEITQVLAVDGDGDPTEVTWTTDVPVQAVVVKSGQECKLYEYPGGATTGTVGSGDGDLDEETVSTVSCGDIQGAEYCSVTDTTGSQTKIEYEDGEFIEEEEDEKSEESEDEEKEGSGEEETEPENEETEESEDEKSEERDDEEKEGGSDPKKTSDDESTDSSTSEDSDSTKTTDDSEEGS